ncbi:hypothetical protein M2139_001028 [Enterococcus sp. PF1-24]|uniref:DUF7278 family profilin-like fold-containing protein n=1 Tax=unclassified Enterococcus TaxID=2608891 RepID=UPI0024739DA8|nr:MULTISPECIES: hypothetical protein [unclassified Enterococcus]MDH6364043.1 hypothetical protein [Enterococcus sp. PFB1-1]MDH6401144.1 hypothetical protein [Enterococcus sp. PF1-24]
MDFISALQWSNWKQLNDQGKQFIFNQITMYFISPLAKVSDVHLANFEILGIKCRTFSLKIDGEPFVLVPGNSEAVLGWDTDFKGIRTSDVMAETPNPKLAPLETAEYDFTDYQEAVDYLNRFTTPLRKAEIPPMLVQTSAIPVGANYKGTLNLITGEFSGDNDFYQRYKVQIQKRLFPELTPAAALTWNSPKELFQEAGYYLRLLPNEEQYLLYQLQETTYHQIVKALHNYNYDLLTEDQWEFACGGGTRQLFRWHPDLLFAKNANLADFKQANMFGLYFDTSKSRFELTNSPDCLKLTDYQKAHFVIVDRLPLATYYRNEEWLETDKVLEPQKYTYRKAILIEA